MPTLYVTEPGAVVRRKAGSIIVTLDADTDKAGSPRENRRRLIEVEPHRLEMIALVGRAHITADVTRLCLEQGIAVAWFTRSGDFLGRLVPELSRTADLRLHQFRMADDTKTAIDLGRTFIEGKLENAAAMIAAIRSNRPGENRFSQAISRLRQMRTALAQAGTRDIIMGIEGEAARRYFSVLGLGFSGPIGFDTRKKRPPPDPANALLSLGYVLLANMLASLLEGRGFDPYVGFLHTVRSGRPSLALDLMEELRHPVVDRFVLRLCNRRQLTPEHFVSDEKRGGVRLVRKGLRRFFQEWERYLNRPMAGIDADLTVEKAVMQQVDRLAAHVRGTVSYQPLLLQGPG